MSKYLHKEDIEKYASWMFEGKGSPLLEAHFLWEYLHTPEKNETLTEYDELDILREYLKLKGMM